MPRADLGSASIPGNDSIGLIPLDGLPSVNKRGRGDHASFH